LAGLLTKEAVGTQPVRIMFQDEARFGRMVRIRRCWTPAPSRPMMDNGYERQFTYVYGVYGAVSPIEGELDRKIRPQMNQFLKQVSQAHREEFIVMVMDGASSHRSQELEIQKTFACTGYPDIRRNSIPKSIYGMSCARRSFPIGFSSQ
jgi:hypothetical protein